MSTTKEAGDQAENAVAQELAAQGYEIVDRNWKTKAAEVDIIAKKEKTIFFVEVKYRRNDYAGDGFDYITAQKMRHMQRAANLWSTQYEWQGEVELLAASVMQVGPTYSIDIREVA